MDFKVGDRVRFNETGNLVIKVRGKIGVVTRYDDYDTVTIKLDDPEFQSPVGDGSWLADGKDLILEASRYGF